MSPPSRGRKGKRSQKRALRVVPREVGPPDDCDCPACLDVDLDPEQAIDGMAETMLGLAAVEDPLDAELGVSALVSFGGSAVEGFETELLALLIPQIEAHACSEAVAILMAIGSVTQGDNAEAAQAAARRLTAAGVAEPKWAGELADPVTVGDCSRLYDLQGAGSMLVCSFRRSGSGHAIVVAVDHADCGAASDILLIDEAELPQVLAAIRTHGSEHGLKIATESLGPAELRWQIENALDARAVHDSEDADGDGSDFFGDEDGPGYSALAALARVRMEALPMPDKPPLPHAEVLDEPAFALPHLAGRAGSDPPRGRQVATGRPAKRKKSAGPAPVYQIKIGLRGAKPPIWRRLEVSGDVNLARLHLIIQVAFGWNDSHLHVFETPFGDFGAADPELGHQAEKSATLQQVAPTVGSRFRYLYDFGDDWEHEILVEKVVDRDPGARYPRCTGGRRAAPPDDCGGMWGYLALIDVLSNPDHPEHQERLAWLGLDDVADFAPDRFDADEVDRAFHSMKLTTG